MKRQLINIGYFITQPIETPDCIKINSKQMVTASHCFCDLHPDNTTLFYDEMLASTPAWWTGENYVEKSKLKTYETSLANLKTKYLQLLDQKRIGLYPDFFSSFQDAKSIQDEFFPELQLFSIALNKQHTELFSKELEFKDYKPIFEEVKIDGDFIGYDILGWDWASFHTYLCNGLEEDLQKEFKLNMNHWGLLDNPFEEVAKFAKSLEGKGEPVLWLPFAVFQHKV